MRDILAAIFVAIMVLGACLAIALAFIATYSVEQADAAQLCNAYWPYSVETCVKDR